MDSQSHLVIFIACNDWYRFITDVCTMATNNAQSVSIHHVAPLAMAMAMAMAMTYLLAHPALHHANTEWESHPCVVAPFAR
jgi:hypothetical protein